MKKMQNIYLIIVASDIVYKRRTWESDEKVM